MKKIYYQLTWKQNSPLRVGNGGSENTDSDLLLDGRGLPFLPGSTVAGILRSMLSERDGIRLFGTVEGDDIRESHVLVSDAVLGPEATAEDIVISVRDGVGLNDWGVTVSGHKYDFETVETQKEYTCVLEWSGEAEQETAVLEELLGRIAGEGISAGARTTRGYGAFSVRARKLAFCFPEDLEQWVGFDAFAPDAFAPGEELQESKTTGTDLVIQAGIKLRGSFSVRVKTSDYTELEDGTLPDSMPLKNSTGRPVVPGTTWAGCFRHHMRDLIRELKGVEQEAELEALDLLFGKAREEGQHRKSKVSFSETEIEGGCQHVAMRNAVDRFTQAPKNTGLYTSAVWQGGSGVLRIRVRENAMSDLQKKLLAAAFIDLDLGLMSFGGEAGVGRGRAEIERLTVNGADRTEELKSLKTDFLEVAL